MGTRVDETKESNEMLKYYEALILVFGIVIFTFFVFLIVNYH